MSAYKNFNEIPALPAELVFDPVKEQQMRNGKPVADNFWIINPNTDEVMGVSKQKHTPTNFNLLWNNFREGIAASGLDTSDLQVRFSKAHNHASFRADIVFKRYKFDRVVGEPTQMKMRIWDSHDSTLKRDVSAMLMRLACTNGMSTVGERLTFKQKHTTLADPERVGSVASTFPERLEAEAELYKVMMGTKVTTDQARDFFVNHVATYKSNRGTKVNTKTVEECMKLWYSYDLGQTGYRLYNVLTHLGTHVEGREGTDIHKKHARIEQNVERIVQDRPFRELTGLALAA